MVKLRLKQLEQSLQEVDTFEDPKIQLEQISTSSHIAARMMYTAAHNYGDIEGKYLFYYSFIYIL
jgi:predicted RNA methylase